jgi:acetoin utilization deacetylase AcuC-like enzyme
MASVLAQLADETCGGKMALMLEGGYDLPALTASVRATLEVLAGRREDFPAGPGRDTLEAIGEAREALQAAGRAVPKS